MTQDVDEKLVQSLTAESTLLIPHLPYILQDLWELGSLPIDIAALVAANIEITRKTRILDLACGKGAVSVKLAKEFGCHVKGIDILPDFVDYAQKKAREFRVKGLCEFIVEDINQSINKETGYDIVILGAVGNLLGDRAETLMKLEKVIKPSGYILIDEAYAKNKYDFLYLDERHRRNRFDMFWVRLVDEIVSNPLEIADANRYNQACIIKRCEELKKTYPQQAALFDRYVQCQQAECDELENDMVGVTQLLQVL